MDSCGEIALTPSATHGAVEEVQRDEDGMGGGENKRICALTTRGLGAPLATSRWREERSENVSREDARRDWIMLMSS